MGVSGATLGVSGGEDGVDKDKGANNFSTKTTALGVAMGYTVGATTVQLEEMVLVLKSFHHGSSGYGAKGLHDDVEHRPSQGQLPS